jgi:glycosyltransferase involved in cell wall biosynthesis
MKIEFLSCALSGCGIGRYTHELATAARDAGHNVHVFRKDAPEEPWISAYKYKSLRGLKHYIAPFFLHRAAHTSRADIFHADYVDAATVYSKRTHGGRLFTTVHDAIPFHFYRSSGRNAAFINYKLQLKNAAWKSEKLITVSEHARYDLAEMSGIPLEKIVAIPNGINHARFFPEGEKPVNERFILRYIGGLGALHKNARMLIEMARILESEGHDFLLEFGSGDAGSTGLPALVRQYGLKNVRFSGMIPDKELRRWLRGADVFVFPSLYEGFGFPPLEAMACGTATISSNAASLPEVVGNAALLAEPTAEAFADAVKSLIYDASLKRAYKKAAVERARQFTWQASAEKTMALWEGKQESGLQTQASVFQTV